MNASLTELFDKYLSGRMTDVETQDFLNLLETNPTIKKNFEEHQRFVQSFYDYHQTKAIEAKFNQWYTEEISTLKTNKKVWWSVSYIAASIALIVTLSVIWLYDTLKKETKKQSNDITYLKKELKQIQNQQNTLVRNFQQIQKQKYAPANSQSTGFLFASKYIITTYHSIQNADSIFIENETYPRTQAFPIYINKNLDVAILYTSKINNPGIPINFLNKSSDLGNKVFTLGFPTSQLVYNEGYISAINGYNNDTAFYQITMPLNPGNSGGALFNNKGDWIGMIVSKNINMEGVAFAIKSTMLYTLKDSLPADSVKQTWTKAFIKQSHNQSISIEKVKPLIFKVFVYQKSI